MRESTMDNSSSKDSGAQYVTLKSIKEEHKIKVNMMNIGALILIGASISTLTGLYKGVRKVLSHNNTGKIYTILLNHVVKEGAGLSNTLGIIGVYYSGCYILLNRFLPKSNDDTNMFISATSSGLIFKSTFVGGAIDLCGSTAYYMYNNFKNNGFKNWKEI
ncbi:mitochondrial import inner membrane translocase subunit Tim23-like [Teleopsis dalmanni]|nr:mitochondrial import inner membrane translocase subunit Tim23-like [Teleopsis dalmanni]